MLRTISIFALCAVLAHVEALAQGEALAQAEQPEPADGQSIGIETVTIVGTRQDVDSVPGSAYFIGAEQLSRFAYTDVQQIMRQVPGVSIQLEDGFGLRPNIGIRGVATERSARITLLEDGVLIAPAPYSAPSAYYFPTAGRMAAFEVLKGPAAIIQGPYTIGGALNMVSTPIPAQRTGRAVAEVGQRASNRLHASYGGTFDSGFGFVLEGHQWYSDGYQKIDRHGGDTGLDVRDYTLKLAYETGPHRVRLKLQRTDQHSEQSYLGLTDAAFRAAPRRRYGLSHLDGIETAHEQSILRYEYASNGMHVALAGYRNTHARNWFKTEGIDLDGSVDAQSLARVSWANVVRAVNRGASIDGWSAQQLNGILEGALDTPPGSIQLRANDRRYVSEGVQLRATLSRDFGAVGHTLQAGVRYHEDEEDRLQRNSSYSQRGGSLVLDDAGLLGNAGNRVQRAQAVALFVQDAIEVGRWTLTPGLRFEDIEQSRVRYETRTGRTDAPASRGAENLRSTRSNSTRVVLPGFGAVYRASAATSLVAGVHKGFSAPTNAPDVDAEEALNYELGVRVDNGRTRFEAMGFLSDYDNMLGVCTASSGVDCEVGDAFNGDAATVRGLELLATTDLAPAEASFAAPLDVAYTWMRAEFDTDIADTDFFGDARAGDPLPYLPKQQLSATLGVAKGRWAAHATLNYVDAVCVRASCGAFERTDAATTLDAAVRLAFRADSSLFLRVDNVADAQDIVGRHPYGARPNKSRTAVLGVDIAW